MHYYADNFKSFPAHQLLHESQRQYKRITGEQPALSRRLLRGSPSPNVVQHARHPLDASFAVRVGAVWRQPSLLGQGRWKMCQKALQQTHACGHYADRTGYLQVGHNFHNNFICKGNVIWIGCLCYSREYAQFLYRLQCYDAHENHMVRYLNVALSLI